MSAWTKLRRVPRRRWQEMRAAYLFLLPALVMYLVFVFWPVIQSIYFGFFDWNGLGKEMTWVGLDNYVNMFVQDEVFRLSLRNSIVAGGDHDVVGVLRQRGHAAHRGGGRRGARHPPGRRPS